MESEQPPTTLQDYDAVPYNSQPARASHPDRLWTVATLLGMQPAPVTQCRVLELGCASGGNLIPMAEALPQSQFVGVDLSERQVTDANAIIRQLALNNISIEHRGIRQVENSLGQFDYIIAHGVYSWVSPEDQDNLLRICRERLAPQGVAFLSYNTLPGWHVRGAMREMMQFHARGESQPALRIRKARQLLEFLTRAAQENPYGLLNSELRSLAKSSDGYLAHDHLEEHNEPVYFNEFARRAKERGLQYVGEAEFGVMLSGNFPPDVEAAMRSFSATEIEVQQYMDFVRDRAFRQSLLCHQEVQLERKARPNALRDMYIASGAQPMSPPQGATGAPSNSWSSDVVSDAPQQFRGQSGINFRVNEPLLKSALQLLTAAWPRAIAFADLFDAARRRINVSSESRDPSHGPERLAANLLHCYSIDTIELSPRPSDFTLTPGPLPFAGGCARLAAARSNIVPNLRHESVLLNDIHLRLLQMLDGQHDRGEIARDLKCDQTALERGLTDLARGAFLRA